MFRWQGGEARDLAHDLDRFLSFSRVILTIRPQSVFPVTSTISFRFFMEGRFRKITSLRSCVSASDEQYVSTIFGNTKVVVFGGFCIRRPSKVVIIIPNSRIATGREFLQCDGPYSGYLANKVFFFFLQIIRQSGCENLIGSHDRKFAQL